MLKPWLLLPPLVVAARGDLVITEIMPLSIHGTTTVNGDWWELTNTGTSAVNLGGYTWDDIPTPDIPTVSYFPDLTILAGESIIILEEGAANVAAWKSAWGLTTTRVIDRDQFTATGGEGFSGLSGPNGDEVNLYDPGGTLVAHVSFGPTADGRSRAFHRDGTPIYGLHSVAGKHGAKTSNQVPADTGSPGDATLHFTSSPATYGQANYTYSITAANPGGATPIITATGLPSFLTLTPGPPGTATVTSNRPLTLADAGNHVINLTATGGASATVQEYLLTVLNPQAAVILNEYNAVAPDNYLNGGDLYGDSDGGESAADLHFGRVLGNGGRWAEFVVTGTGGPGLLDLRGWKVEIGRNAGFGFAASATLVLSNHPDWQAVPSGTVLTFIDRNTAQGGLDSGFAIRNRRATTGDTWSNIWIGDPDRLVYTSPAVNGYSIIAGQVIGIPIDNSGTQFRVRNAAGQFVFGPAGEGVAPRSGTTSEEVFELEDHPTPAVSPIVASTATTQGYDDGASDSTFGHPNNWLADTTTVTQSFTGYVADGFLQWTELHALTGQAALRTADPDGDGRTNLEEYAFGGVPTRVDSAHGPSTISSGAVIAWSYVRRGNDPALVFGHEASTDLATWNPVTAAATGTVPSPGDPAFSTVTLQFDRPVPAPAAWFLRARVE